MLVTLFPFTSADFPGLLGSILDVYDRAFAIPPYIKDHGDRLAFEASIQRHADREGFRGYWACDPYGKLVGFAYGYTGGPGQWWYDTVSQGMAPELIERWLSDYFEFVELAVDPDMQGRGIGGRLHDMLISGARHATAALTTAQDETDALFLYRKRGWVTIRENYIFPGDSIFRRIMARDLTIRP